MSLPLILLPEAEDELSEAMHWHEERRPGLGHELLGVVHQTLAQVRQTADAGRRGQALCSAPAPTDRMLPETQELLNRLARDPDYARTFFEDPAEGLAGLDLPDAEREALARLSPETVRYLADGADLEPDRAAEHPGSLAGLAGPTAAIALWGCVAYVLLWLVATGSL